METTIVYWSYILYICLLGDRGKNMETTKVYWGYIGILEEKMETTIF